MTEQLTNAWIEAYRPLDEEVQCELPIVEGALPADLRGVLYRNGPGRLGVGGQMYGHLFDGDGMVLRLAFGADSQGTPRLHYRNRYVRTAQFIEEERAGRLLYRNFGTNRPGGLHKNFLRMRFKNSANTNVIHSPAHPSRPDRRDELLALWEGGLPHRLDPVTLETLGPCDFDGGLLNRGNWLARTLSPRLPFAAHPRYDVASGDLYNFGMLMGQPPKLLLYRISEGVFAPLGELALRQLSFVHDFVLTPNWLIFFLYPVAFDIPRALIGLKTPVEALMPLADAPTQVLMVPRSLFAPGAPANGSQEMPRISADQVRWFSAAPCFVFHFVNAYEDARGQVVIDGMRVGSYPHFAAPAQLVRAQELVKPTQRLTRFVIDPAAPAQSRAHEEVLSSHPGELPRTHPQHQGLPYRYGYAIGAPAESPYPFLNCILRYDTVEKKTLIRDLGAAVPGEPVMVPRAAAKSEDDGYVLTLVYDGKRGRSLLYVLDARDLSTVAVAMLPHHVPPGFHGNFVPSAPLAAA